MSVHSILSSLEDRKYHQGGSGDELKSFWLNQYRELTGLTYDEKKKRQATWDKYYLEARNTVAYARYRRMMQLFRDKNFGAELQQLHKETKEALNGPLELPKPPFLDPEEVMRKSWQYRQGDKKSSEADEMIKVFS